MTRTARLLKRVAWPAAGLAVLLSAWQAIGTLGLVAPNLLPSPSDVAKALFEMAADGTLAVHAAASLWRVTAGFSLAALVAVPLGIVMARNLATRWAVEPFVQMARTVSPLAWIPFAVLWLGIGDAPAVFIVFITTFFPILFSTLHGVLGVDASIVKTAVNFGASGTTLVRKVLFPAALPRVMVGLRLSLGLAWVIIVAAEMVGMRAGLGYLILDARNLLQLDRVAAVMITIGLIGLALDKSMTRLERSLVERRHPTHAAGKRIKPV